MVGSLKAGSSWVSSSLLILLQHVHDVLEHAQDELVLQTDLLKQVHEEDEHEQDDAVLHAPRQHVQEDEEHEQNEVVLQVMPF